MGNSRPGVLAKKLRRCEEEGGRADSEQTIPFYINTKPYDGGFS